MKRLFVTVLALVVVGCAEPKVTGGDRVTARFNPESGGTETQVADLVPVEGGLAATSPLRVRLPLRGGAAIRIDLDRPLPVHDFGDLSVVFETRAPANRHLGTGIGSPWTEDALREADGRSRVAYELDWVQDSVDELLPGRTLDLVTCFAAGCAAGKIRVPVEFY